MGRKILISILLTILLFCSLLYLYRLLIDLDASKCYVDDAAYYQVEPTFFAIRKAIMDDVNRKAIKGMNVDEVFSIIKNMKNFKIVRDDRYDDLNRFIKVDVRTCFFFQNNFSIYFSFFDNRLDSDVFTIESY